MLNKIVEIATNKLPNPQILNMYKSGKLTKAEALLLLSTENDAYFWKYLSGVGEFRLYYDSNVSTDLYYTNVPEMLCAFYSMHIKYPDYHFDKMIESYLISYSSHKGMIYKILSLLYYHVQNEKKGTATFSINNIEILSLCKKTINANIPYFIENRLYEAADNKEGFLGVIKNYNCEFKEILNFNLFDNN